MKKNLFCLSTYVYGDYCDYIPSYIYAALKSYPDIFVKIFVHDMLPRYINKILAYLKKNFSDNFEIVENVYKERIPHNYLRWLLPDFFFNEFEYVLINDIDILILREEPSLLDFRLKHSKSFNLPFSNFLRHKKQNSPGRFSGSHFIVVKPYYEKVQSIINKILIDPLFDISRENVNFFSRGINNWSGEKVLYQILKKSFAIDEVAYGQANNNFPHHHGIHLGLFASGKLNEKNLGINKIFFQQTEQLENIINNDLFIYLVNKLKNREIKKIFKVFIDYFNNI